MTSPYSFERLGDQLASNFDGEFFLDQTTRRAYATDASLYEELPRAVAIPASDEDIRQLILLCNATRIGLIPRTAGTSLAGQVVGSGIVVDVSKYLNRILEIDTENRWVRVQPGVIRNELNMELAKYGMMFGPETSTANRAMIGGMVGNNSCGSNSIKYGSVRDHLLELVGFLSDGSKVVIREGVDHGQKTVLGSGSNYSSRLEEICRQMQALLADSINQRLIRENFPKRSVTRRNTGYALDVMLDGQPFAEDGPPFNLCKLIAGSEGTLFFATEMKLRCVPLPPRVAGLLCVHFDSIDQSLRATKIAMQFQPYSCELIDQLVLKSAARNLEQRNHLAFVEGDPAAILVIELRGDSEQDVRAQTEQVAQAIRSSGFGFAFPLLMGAEGNKVWELRRAGLGVLSNIPGDAKPITVIEDTAVAVDDLADYIAELNLGLREQFGLECVHYAHAGAGELHLRPVINLKTDEGLKQFRDVATLVANLVRKWKGSLSGEHGDGRLRGEFLRLVLGDETYELCRKVKSIWDPAGIFNPGKIVDAPPMDASLRTTVGPNPTIATIFDFSDAGGMLGSAEMCSGSGDCRKTHKSGGTMCPSYMATRDEKDTTRARANLLRQAMSKTKEAQWPLDDPETRSVLDLCLSCKGCKRECPSNVDMAKLKAEFMQAHYDRHGTPMQARLVAGFARQASIASLAPAAYNAVISNRTLGKLLRNILGFHPNRSLPALSKLTLRRWFVRRRAPRQNSIRAEVILFCDEFTNYLDVPIGIAAVELLEGLGYKVRLLEHDESGRAAISKGLLRQARSIAEKNVRLLSQHVSPTTPLIGIEPSAILTFRDEYPVLLRGNMADQARRLADSSFLLDEFLASEFRSRRILPEQFSDQTANILVHGHCHQKALSSLADTVQILRIPSGHKVNVIPSGCCGMAGSFGYEKNHFELSMQIGELVLFPAIRSAPPGTLIAAPGTSCRHQIHDGLGVQALHPAQILREALLASSQQ